MSKMGVYELELVLHVITTDYLQKTDGYIMFTHTQKKKVFIDKFTYDISVYTSTYIHVCTRVREISYKYINIPAFRSVTFVSHICVHTYKHSTNKFTLKYKIIKILEGNDVSSNFTLFL